MPRTAPEAAAMPSMVATATPAPGMKPTPLAAAAERSSDSSSRRLRPNSPKAIPSATAPVVVTRVGARPRPVNVGPWMPAMARMLPAGLRPLTGLPPSRSDLLGRFDPGEVGPSVRSRHRRSGGERRRARTGGRGLGRSWCRGRGRRRGRAWGRGRVGSWLGPASDPTIGPAVRRGVTVATRRGPRGRPGVGFGVGLGVGFGVGLGSAWCRLRDRRDRDVPGGQARLALVLRPRGDDDGMSADRERAGPAERDACAPRAARHAGHRLVGAADPRGHALGARALAVLVRDADDDRGRGVPERGETTALESVVALGAAEIGAANRTSSSMATADAPSHDRTTCVLFRRSSTSKLSLPAQAKARCQVEDVRSGVDEQWYGGPGWCQPASGTTAGPGAACHHRVRRSGAVRTGEWPDRRWTMTRNGHGGRRHQHPGLRYAVDPPPHPGSSSRSAGLGDAGGCLSRRRRPGPCFPRHHHTAGHAARARQPVRYQLSSAWRCSSGSSRSQPERRSSWPGRTVSPSRWRPSASDVRADPR